MCRQPRGAAAALTGERVRAAGTPEPEGGRVSPTLEFLVDCVSAHRLPEARARLRRRLQGPVDWDDVVRSARQHGVTPLVHRELRAAPPDCVPADTLGGLRQEVRENARRCLLLAGWLRRVVDGLAAAGIPAVPYKGPVLAALAYGSIADRRAGDLDLLIDPGDLPAARAALERDGFRPVVALEAWQERHLVRAAHPYGFVRDPEGVVVELHWSVSPRSLSAGLGEALPRERLEAVALAGTTFHTLPGDVLLLALCVHGAKHVWGRLSWIVDVAELIAARPTLDWTALLARADQAGHARELLLGCLLARDLLGAALPEALSRRIAREAELPGLARTVRAQLVLPPGEQLGIADTARFHLGVRATWGARLAYCRFAMMPTVADWSAIPLPRWLAPLHYPLRAVRLMVGGAAHPH
jgi:hypothetical protein